MEAISDSDFSSFYSTFDEQIKNICFKLALLDRFLDAENGPEETIKMILTLTQIQSSLYDCHRTLSDAEEEFRLEKKRCDRLFKLTIEHLDYIEQNMTAKPEHNAQPMDRKATFTNLNVKNLKNKINQKGPTPQQNGAKTTTTASSTKKVAPKSIVATSNQTFPQMEHINDKEYDSIPKYILNRLSLIALNESVDAINSAITSKYTFMKKFDVQSTKEAEYKRFQGYKSQEFAETKGIYFVTMTDIKELSPMKNDATLRKVLTCLRHCKRLKEIRGNPSKLIRYGLI